MRAMIAVVLLLGLVGAVAAQDVMVKVYVDGKLQQYKPEARMRAGSVYVPLRAGAESLGCSVKWHADQNKAQVCTDESCIMIAKSEGIMVDGSLLLPLRKMGEATGAKVVWDAGNKAVMITRPAPKPQG